MKFLKNLKDFIRWFFGEKFGGLIPQPRDGRDWEFKPASTSLSSVSLRAEMPGVTNQGWYNSCTAHAIGALVDYYATYKKTNASWSINFSEAFQWYMNRQMEGNADLNVGVWLRNSFKVITKHGFTTESFWNYKDGWDVEPSWEAKESARMFGLFLGQFGGYYYINTKDVETIKQALSEELPVIFGFPVTSEFKKLKKPGVYEPERVENVTGYHAMLFTGYKPGYFEVRNSWGKNWGDNGYCWISEDVVKKHAFDMWTLR